MKLKTQFDFSAAHRLVGYKGICQALHGHTWLVKIEVEGNKLDDVGILWDFTNGKKIKEYFDHKTILKICKENQDLVYTITKSCGSKSLCMLHGNPTAENIAKWILNYLKLEFKCLKFKVTVWESPKSYAEVEDEIK